MPKSLVRQWLQEWLRHTDATDDSVLIYHGAARPAVVPACARLVITTYGTVMSAYKAMLVAATAAAATNRAKTDASDDRTNNSSSLGCGSSNAVASDNKRSSSDMPSDVKFAAIFGTIGSASMPLWRRVVMDEAHVARGGVALPGDGYWANRKAANAKMMPALCALVARAQLSWCMTGTPFNNRVSDVCALFKLAGVAPYDNPRWWSAHQADARAISVMRDGDASTLPVMLVRDKSALSLPPLVRHDVQVEMTHEEAKVHDAIALNVAEVFDAYSKLRSKEALSMLLTLILRMRQACTHLSLLRAVRSGDASNSGGVAAGCNSSGANSSSGDGTSGSSSSSSKIDDASNSDGVAAGCNSSSSSSGANSSSGDGTSGSGSSSKMDRLRRLLADVWRADPSRGVIVFSQWTAMLDLVQHAVGGVAVAPLRIDGDTSAADRMAAVDAFQSRAVSPLLLASLHAGGLGLNLTRASVVVFMEPWYNPFVERQATDRAHRYGQRAPVVDVYHLYAANSMEDWMRALCKRKTEAARLYVGDVYVGEGGGGGDGSTFSVEEVGSLVHKYLSRIRHAPAAAAAATTPIKEDASKAVVTHQRLQCVRGGVKKKAAGRSKKRKQNTGRLQALRAQFDKERRRQRTL